MSIGISRDHQELADALGSWARARGVIDIVRAAEADPAADFADITKELPALGLPGIGVPQERGGAGGDVLDVAVAVEALAEALVPGPLLGTTLLSVLDPELWESTKAVVSIAPGAEIRVAEGRVDAVVEVAWDAFGASHLLAPGANQWWLVDLADALLTPLASPDLSRRAARVEVNGAAAAPVANGAQVRELLVTLSAAEASGVAQWCVHTAVEYAKVREQFGAPIGSFQAVKHLCAQMLEQAESVTAVAWDAARAFGEAQSGQVERETQVAMATSAAGAIAVPAAIEVAQSCIQVLGGIGFTFEHDAHLYLRRLLALRAMNWPASAHEQRLARLAQRARRSALIDYEGADAAVREEVRRLISVIDPADPRPGLVSSGLLAPHWPPPYGRGASPVEQLVIDEELARAGIERPDIKIAGWAVPTIVFSGTDQQRERFVLPSLRGDIVWCQLFSEPGAGSDLASLRTRAVRVDGGWELTGQKVWTSLAHSADWGIALARTDTDVPAHRGISYFLVEMNSPGLSIRPLREMTGEAMFNEVFFDSVFVPDDLMVGQPGDGWALARATLANERVAMASTNLGTDVEAALALAEDLDAAQLGPVGHAVALAQVAGLLGDRATLRSLEGTTAGPESSIAKLVGVRARQEAATLVMEMLGERAVLGDDRARRAVHQQLLTRCLSIAGGTTQVLRNVVAERILGLPR